MPTTLDALLRLREPADALQRLAEPFARLGGHADALTRLSDTVGSAFDGAMFGQSLTARLASEGSDWRRNLGVIGESRIAQLVGGRESSASAARTSLAQGAGAAAARVADILGGQEYQPEAFRQLASTLSQSAAYANVLAQDALGPGRLGNSIFRLPERGEAAALSQAALGARPSPLADFGSAPELQAAMEAMRNPWLRAEEASRSANAFASVQAIGRTLADRSPFDEWVGSGLRSSLGDWRDHSSPAVAMLLEPHQRTRMYIERGFDPSLTDFSPSAFDESTALAGLRAPEDGGGTHDDAETAGDEIWYKRSRAAFDKLLRFEVAVRRYLDDAMRTAYGDGWEKRQLPPNMLAEWRERKQQASKAGGPDLPLIYYADFTHYKAMIERSDNWNKVFKAVFGRPEDVRESFQRLFPIRVCAMHARPITLDDELLLAVETQRVLAAIEKAKASRHRN